MKYRQCPEDFIVEEIPLPTLQQSQKQGKYHLYLLEKRSLETFSLVEYIAKKNNIPRSSITFAGLKDKHAITKQYITIPTKYNIKETKEQNYSLKHVGFTDKPLEIGDLHGNKFTITVRDIRKGELDGIQQKASTLTSIGVPNYFDSQRFGSVVRGEFIAKAIMKKDYETAVKIFLTHYTKFENKKIKDEKRMMEQHWKTLETLHITTPHLKRVQQTYAQTKDWLRAYLQISASLRELYVSAYQSYLWNECIKELLRKTISGKYLYTIPYALGTLVFYKKLSEQERQKIPETFQTISDKLKPTTFEEDIAAKVLTKEKITLQEFNIKKATENFFKTQQRKISVFSEQFKITPPVVDNKNDKGKNNRFKIAITFALLKGSYATIVLKRLFNQ